MNLKSNWGYCLIWKIIILAQGIFLSSCSSSVSIQYLRSNVFSLILPNTDNFTAMGGGRQTDKQMHSERHTEKHLTYEV